MAWFAVVKRSDGQLVSVGTVIASPLPAELEAITLPGRIDSATQRWDAATRTVVAKPAKLPDVDRVNDFFVRATFLDARLTTAQRTQFRTILGTFLGTRRFRDAAETVDL